MKPKKVEVKNVTAVQKPTEVKNATASKEFMNATEFKKVNESSAAQKNVSGTTKNVTNTTVKETVVETIVSAQKNVSKNSSIAQNNVTKSVVS